MTELSQKMIVIDNGQDPEMDDLLCCLTSFTVLY
jgi:hypothetical protein